MPMKKLGKFLLTTAIVIVLLSVSGKVTSPAVAKKRNSEKSSLAIPSGKVTIYRDDWGVPHIYANAEEDGFYGLGYVQAEDQLELVLRRFLTVRGEMAAAFGSDHIKSDLEQRRWMHVEEARAGLKRLNPQLLKNYQSYIAGLQRYMDEYPNEVPQWAPKLEAADVVAVSRAVLWAYMVTDGLQDLQRAGIKIASNISALVEEAVDAASNEWILAPWRTAENAMVVLSDPHGGIDGSWVYEFRLDAGPLKVGGYCYGALFILTHNRHLSWGMTTGAPDVSDCYEITVDPENPLRYQYDGKWQTMVTRKVTIVVKDGKPVTQTLEYTQHNGILSAVVARQNGKAYAVSTPYMHQAGLFDEEVYRINLARNVREVREAMKLLGMFPQNFMVGDSEGNSFYVRAGRTPRRPSGFDWNRPVPGNTSDTAWMGILPLEDLVQIENPVQGYMQNCNIAPDTMMKNCPLTADRYASYIFNDTPGRTNTRGIRAVEVLSAADQFSVQDAIDLSLDEKWVGTEVWQKALMEALKQNPHVLRNKPLAFSRFVGNLLRFDGHARKDSVAALSYLYWRSSSWSMPGLSDEEKEALSEPLWEKGDLSPALGEILLRGVDRAIDSMIKELGTTDLTYGDVHRIGRGGYSWPLGGGTLMPGSSIACAYTLKCIFTLRAMTFGELDKQGHRWPWLGSRMLRLVIFTNPLQSYTLHLFGQSEHKDSPHYTDQARLASERRLKPTYFYKEDLLKHVVSQKDLQ